jgi:large subunit ribosomal protein L13
MRGEREWGHSAGVKGGVSRAEEVVSMALTEAISARPGSPGGSSCPAAAGGRRGAFCAPGCAGVKIRLTSAGGFHRIRRFASVFAWPASSTGGSMAEAKAMKANRAKTYLAKPGEVEQKWHLVDADGKVLGRLASKVATILMGKHKPRYTPSVDTGDFVVVVNVEKVAVTGRKREQAHFRRYSGYMGGLKKIPFETMMKLHPTHAFKTAVRRMLPKSRLGRKMLTKLKVYAGAEHPHAAQQPQPLEL